MRAAAAALCILGCAKSGAHPTPTTDGALAVANLSAQIAGQEQSLQRAPRSIEAMAALIELLQTRVQYTGSVSDFRRIAALGEQAVAVSVSDEALLARASSSAALHRFAAALRDLDRMRDGEAALPLRASILQARGDLQGAVALRRSAVARYASTRTLGSLAAAEGAAGDAGSAARDFAAAEAAYRDSSPFPLAWTDLQRGLLAERRGELAAAERSYSAALARLPQYAQARGHLAGVLALEGRPVEAEDLLQPLAASDDPEYEGQLSRIARDPARRAALREHAARRYDALLAEFPEAFADHAARFFLDRDPARALSLARMNLAARPTAEAFDLALSAAVLAGATDCSLARDALSQPSAPARFRMLAGRICLRR